MIDSKPHIETTTTKKVLIKTIETRDGQVKSTSSDFQSMKYFSDVFLTSDSELITFSLSSASLFRWSMSQPRTTMKWSDNGLSLCQTVNKSNIKKHNSLGLANSKQLLKVPLCVMIQQAP